MATPTDPRIEAWLDAWIEFNKEEIASNVIKELFDGNPNDTQGIRTVLIRKPNCSKEEAIKRWYEKDYTIVEEELTAKDIYVNP